MESFETRLDRAIKLVPLTTVDDRLNSSSVLSIVQSGTDHMPPIGRQFGDPPDINVSYQLRPVSEGIIREDDIEIEPDMEEEDPIDLDGDGEPDDPEMGDPDAITQDDLPAEEPAGGMPSGNEYTIDMAKGQLDGIIEKWMDLAGNYPEGEQRHNFLEIGERLREISGVLNRDFIQNRE